MTRLSDKRGFTLLELLLALVMLTIVLGAIYSTFFLSHRAVTAVDESLLRLQECRMFIDTLAREIDSSIYLPGKTMIGMKIEDRDIYGKQTSRFTFTALSPLRPGLSQITYYIENRDNNLVLLKKMLNPYREESAQKSLATPVELIEGVDSFTLEARNGTSWIRTWDTAEIGKVPDELRVTITFKTGERLLTLYETMKPKIGKSL